MLGSTLRGRLCLVVFPCLFWSGACWGLQCCVLPALQCKVQPLPGPWGLRGGCKVCLGAGVSLNGARPLVFVPSWCMSLAPSLSACHWCKGHALSFGVADGACPLHRPLVFIPSEQCSVAPQKDQEEQSSAGTGGRAAPLPLHRPPCSASLLFTKSLHFAPFQTLLPEKPQGWGCC